MTPSCIGQEEQENWGGEKYLTTGRGQGGTEGRVDIGRDKYLQRGKAAD